MQEGLRVQTDRQRDRQSDERTDERTDRETERQTGWLLLDDTSIQRNVQSKSLSP